MFETPVLFLIFNRPDTTARVFAQIKKVQPKFLYIAADGPRNEKQEESELCAEVRDIVLSNIDWDCELKMLFRKTNLGCGKAVSEAITWFFENVEQGIIIEDDCLPEISFFYYCEELLNRYKYDEKIISIGGTNLGYDISETHSYDYSRILNVWGWATWRRSAILIDYNMNQWKGMKFKQLFLLFRTKNNVGFDFNWSSYWQYYFDLTCSGKIDTWDYHWIFTQIYYNKISIFPSKNLVKNIGFTDKATHTKYPDHPIAKMEMYPMEFPLKIPAKMVVNEYYEEEYLKKIWFENKREPLINIIKTKLLYNRTISSLNNYLKKISKKNN